MVRDHRGDAGGIGRLPGHLQPGRPHRGRGMNGRTPAKAFAQGIPKTNRKEEPANLKTVA